MAKKILLVEDEIMIREMYEIILKQRGYDVDAVEDGDLAIDKLLNKKNHFDIVLLDIMLPRVNGMDVLKKIKSSDSVARDTPIYLLTNLGQESIMEAAHQMGASGYLIKSHYLPAQIADKVDQILGIDTTR